MELRRPRCLYNKSIICADDTTWRATVCRTGRNAHEVRANLVVSMNPHDDNAWRHEESCTDATAPDAGAKLRTSITHHHNDALQLTELCTDGCTLHAMVKLRRSTILHGDDAWLPLGRFIKATAPDARVELHENEKHASDASEK